MRSSQDRSTAGRLTAIGLLIGTCIGGVVWLAGMDRAQRLAVAGLGSVGMAVAVLTMGALLVGTSRASRAVASVGALVLVAVRLKYAFVSTPNPFVDFRIFRIAGRIVLEGGNPYAMSANVFINPPTALPLCVGFAAMPDWVGHAWLAFNFFGGLALVPLAWLALGGRREGRWLPEAFVLAILAAVIGFSDAAVVQNNLGQISTFTALAILGSLALLATGRRLAGGLGLAVATMKVATMLPFCLVAIDRKKIDFRCLAGIALGVVVLCCSATRPDLLPSRLADNLRRIGAQGEIGRINDQSFSGPVNWAIIGFQHAYYRLGIVDRRLLVVMEGLTLAALGVPLAWAAWRRVLARPALLALLGLYATIFLYHRTYDLVLLALPLTYATGLARRGPTRARGPAAASGMAMVIALYLRMEGLRVMNQGHEAQGWVARSFLASPATWLVLVALALLARAAWCTRGEELPAAATTTP